MMRKKLATKFRQCYQHANQSHVATADAPSKSSLKPLYVVCKANLHMLGTKILWFPARRWPSAITNLIHRLLVDPAWGERSQRSNFINVISTSIEEYCRFHVDDAPLKGPLKPLYSVFTTITDMVHWFVLYPHTCSPRKSEGRERPTLLALES